MTLTSIAFHLPQFHEVAENNDWWGEGFTEWTHVRAAKPRWPGHRIRRPVPPLGEYDLTDPRVLELQSEIATAHGIDGFAVWDYWFGAGRQLLERPIQTVLEQKLRFRYCLAWANHSWFDKARGRLLCEQQYLGTEDYELYFRRALRHFETDNYIKIDGKPVFFIFDPYAIPDWENFLTLWRRLAQQAGFPDMFFIADRLWEGNAPIDFVDRYSNGFRFMTRRNKLVVNFLKEQVKLKLGLNLGPYHYDFRRLIKRIIPDNAGAKFAPTVITGWDTTTRHGKNGMIFEHLDVAAVRQQMAMAGSHYARFPDEQHVLLLKSWNEWAEGNVLEPDDVFGDEMLRAVRGFLSEQSKRAT